MKLKDTLVLDGVKYSPIYGHYYKEFSFKNVAYKAVLEPFAMTGSACTIIKLDVNDPNNITSSISDRKVFYERFSNFKPENVNTAIKNFKY